MRVSPSIGTTPTRISGYHVVQVHDSWGTRFAVVYHGQYRFIKQTMESATKLAEKLNRIRKRRTENV